MDISLDPRQRRRGPALLATTAGCLLAGSLPLPGTALAQTTAQTPVPEELEAIDEIDLGAKLDRTGPGPHGPEFRPLTQ
ncbi:hypothetical protein H1235_02815 [Pseudoxanthomonas sp. NC8]|nr:hypothetical protein H1235_02815 [Pseudoxanthomonas sp. NC8]